jgi:hypothetical protein
MRRGTKVFSVLALALSVALLAIQFASASASSTRPEHVLRYRAAFEARLAHAAEFSRGSSRPVAEPILDDFTIVGHADLGLTDTNGDVWVHKNYAYVGTWSQPCNGLGVKVIDISNPANPVMIGRVAGIPGTSAEDVVVRSISTPSFTGDLLAAGIQRCDYEDPALDDDQFGVDLWNVTNPVSPQHIGHFGLANGGGGAHELDLFQRGVNAYVLAATPGTEWFDPVPAGEFRIVDVTNPAAPVQVGEWGAAAEGFSPGPFYGQGSFGSMFDHSARASADGTEAYVSYWDLGVLTLDITDVTNPALVSRTQFTADADGDAHSVVPYSVGGRDFLLQNDEDFDSRSPAHVVVDGSLAGVATESPFAPALFSSPRHRVTGRTVRPRGEGCSVSDYRGLRVDGRIAVPKTRFPFFDTPPGPEPACRARRQDRIANRLGAAAVVHDFISDATSPQWFDATDVPIPVLFTDHATARAMVLEGRARLVALEPSWGFLRVFDANTGEQVASFSDLPYVHDLEGPVGDWSIHNTEVNGDVAYSSWYSHGIVALDLTPLASATPGDPVMVGQFVPEGFPAPAPGFHDGVPDVWGVFVRASDDLVFASDMAGGLWIVRPEGDAAP